MADDRVRDAAVCGACGERQVRLQRHEYEDEDRRQREYWPVCGACGHRPSPMVYRENRLDDLLPPLPDDSGAVCSDNLPIPPEGEDAAVCVVLGPREWESMASRTSLTFTEDGLEVTLEKGRGPGVGFESQGGDLLGVEIHLPSEALHDLHDLGIWSDTLHGSTIIHVQVAVLADA